MKKFVYRIISCALAAICLVSAMCLSTSAAIEGDFGYIVSGSDVTVEIISYRGNDEAVVIPSELGGKTVIGIDKSAFQGNSFITSVSIPDTVTRIGDYAFEDCEKLYNIELPDTIEKIGVLAFYGTARWTSESSWEDGALYIGKHLINYKGEEKITYEVKEGTVCIGANAFRYTNVTSVVLPGSVKGIGEGAFDDCKYLRTVNIPEGLKRIDKYTFSDCPELEGITLHEGIKYIGELAFCACSSLKSIDIPASVVIMSEGCFAYCSSLESINVSPSNSVYRSADGVVYKGASLFCYPGGKTDPSYSVPQGVTELCYSAFKGANNLQVLNIPASVNEINPFALLGMGGLTEINVAEENERYKSVDGVLFENDGQLLSKYPRSRPDTAYTVPEGVKELEYHAFDCANNLTELTLPEGVITMGKLSDMKYLETLNLPESLESMHIKSFTFCPRLKTINYAGTYAQWQELSADVNTERFTVICHGDSVVINPPTEPTEAITEPTETTVMPTETTVIPSESTAVTTVATIPTESTAVTTTATIPEESTTTVTVATDPEETTTAPTQVYILGDVNRDSKLNIRDATLVQKYLAKISELDAEQLTLADYDKNSKVNIKDATSIQKKIANII